MDNRVKTGRLRLGRGLASFARLHAPSPRASHLLRSLFHSRLKIDCEQSISSLER